MRPCIGIIDVCPPLAKYSDFKDGTYNLTDCLRFHLVLDQQFEWHQKVHHG